METWLRHFWQKIWKDEAYFVGRVRATIMMVALNGMAFGKQLAETLGNPMWETRIKLIAVLAGGASLLLTAGEKNVKQGTLEGDNKVVDFP